jgi:hypothetical protein
LIDDEEIELDKNFITAQKLGHRFNKMRLSKDLNQRPRLWKITRNNLATMFAAYRIPLPEEIEKNLDSGLGNIGKIGYIGDIGDNPSNLANLANDESGENAPILPEISCYSCGSTAWYIGAAGNAVCGVCHPAAAKVEKAIK